MKKYPITFWYGIPRDLVSDERIKEAVDAGFTVIESRYDVETNKKVLRLCEKYGVEASIFDDRMYNALNGEEGWEKSLDAIVEDYKDFPALRDYFLRDEPEAFFFPNLARVKEYLKKIDPKHKALINLLPVIPLESVENYENNYMNPFMEQIRPEILSYDHYCLIKREVPQLTNLPEALVSKECREHNKTQDIIYEKYNRPGYYYNLAEFRELSLAHNIPWMVIIQVVEHWMFRFLSEAEIRWEVYQAMAYGPSCISYFTYWTPENTGEAWSYHHALINTDGTKNNNYYVVSNINKEIAAIGELIQNAKSEAVFHVGDEVDEKIVAFTSYKGIESIDAETVTIGFFDNDMFIIANKTFENSQKVAARSSKKIKHFNKKSFVWESLEHVNNVYFIELNSGDGELFMFD